MIEAKVEGNNIVETPTEHIAPVIDIMEALKRSLAEKRKPAQAATAVASAAGDQEELQLEEAPKKRARKSKAGSASWLCVGRRFRLKNRYKVPVGDGQSK